MVVFNYKMNIMKQMMTKMVVGALALGLLISCEAEEDRNSLPPTGLAPTEINISVTQNPQNANEVTMTNLMDDVIPYWSYQDSNGNELGHSNKETVTTTFPFAGTYKVFFTAYTRGGAVAAEPINVNVSSNNAEYFSAPEWNLLTNGVEGKTWVLDMASPIGWAGTTYPWGPADNWNWYPDYAGNEWVMPNKNWGTMRFDLNGGYNVSVTQTALTGNNQTTKTGSFNYNIEGHTLTFNGGVEMLYGGDYYPDASNWTTVDVIELTANSMRLAVLRDQSRTGEGRAKIVFHFKPAP